MKDDAAAPVPSDLGQDAIMERRSDGQVVDKLGKAVEPDSVLGAEDFSAYAKLAVKVGADRRVFSPPKDDWLSKATGHAARRKGALGLGRVNAHHETMKTLVNRRLRGVSTKYLPNDLVMLRLERRPPPSPRETLHDVFGVGYLLPASSTPYFGLRM